MGAGRTLFRSDQGVTLLGGAPVPQDLLTQALALAPALVAADGGADRALAADRVPDAVIGDFDSVSATALAAIPENRLFHIAEQDSTDFDKALRSIAAPFVLCLGFLGGRLDHTLAALSTLVAHRTKRCILLDSGDICFHAPPDIRLDLVPGTRLSLYPLAAVEGESDGLRWPIAGLRFRPDDRIGTSNEVTGPVRLRFQQPGMLVILPGDGLAPVLRALGCPGHDGA